MFLRNFLATILFFSLILSSEESLATHIMGGEITWECQANGQYVFTLKVYRDCNGVDLNITDEAIEAHDYPAPGAITLIPLTFFSVTDITPSCEGSPCATLSQSDPDIPGAIEEYVLQSAPTTLNGVPPANGWTFTWTSGNRNAAIDNINNAQNFGITLRAKMFPFQGRNANLCFDSSPDFFQKPSSIICAGEKFTYNHSAFDNELDSLAYSWAQPLDGNACGTRPCQIGGVYQENVNPAVVPFDAANNYSFNSPFPDATQDPRNVPAVLDPITGEITFTSYNQGEFVSVIRVEAFKCGDKIAEIYRELQTVILSGCASNEPPEIPSPFANGTFSDTVKAGDLVEFDFSIYDTLRSDNPKDDSLFIFGSGQQFGANFTDSTTGCANPPCATLSSPLPDTGIGTYTSTIRWQTSCDHIANGNPTCVATQNTYLFVLRAFDDFCPAAGQAVATFSITVLADTLVESPNIHCADVQANGDVIIDWNQTADPDSSFRQWKVYSSTNRNGPYTLIDSISDYDQTTYTHNGANANDQSIHYIVRAESGCHNDWFLIPTDTISTMYIDPSFNNSCVDVSWNVLNTPLPSGSDANYEVYREYPIGSGFNLYTTTSTTNFCDSFSVCTDSVTYRIQLGNTGNGCTGSSSNIKGIRFQYPDPLVNAGNTIDMCTGQTVQIGGSPSGDASSSFSWSPNDSINDNTLPNPAVNPLDTIKYYLTVTDTLGCVAMDSVLVNVQPTPQADAGKDTIVCGQDLPYQLNGSVTETNSGRWIGGNGTFTPDRNTLNATYQPSIAEINNGSVSLQMVSTNVGICDPDTDLVVITISRFFSAVNFNTTSVSCNGLSDGAVGVSALGANSPYTFQWNTSSGIQQTDTLSGLLAGTYTVTATNTFGCDSILTVNIAEPSILTSSISSTTNASCQGFSDGLAVASANGGTPPYTYLWSDNQTLDTAKNLAAGTYTVTISDNNSCTVTEGVTIGEPALLVSSIGTSTNASCNGFNDGQAAVLASGGTAPYTYLWSDNQTQDTARNLAAGTFTVTVTDQNSCTSTADIIITEPAILNATIPDTTHVSCNGLNDGDATVSGSGGTAPYTYLWNDNQSSSQATNLAAGTYTVTLSDANSCLTTETVTITEPLVLNANVSYQENVSCNGLSDGLATVETSGGTAPYTYLWSNNQTSDTSRNLGAGNYSVTVTDQQNCTATASVNIGEPTLLTVSTQVSSTVSCNGLSDGVAVATPTGGTSPYTYLWSNNQISDTAKNLSAGTYTITVTDQNSCSALSSVTINQPAILVGNIVTSTNVSCNGLSDGRAVVNPNGGTAPYTYLWSNNQTSDTAQNLNAGSYTVTITDQNQCTATTAIVINEPTILQTSISSSSNISCNGGNNGTATVSANGGTAPYTYLWSDNQSTSQASNLQAGTYTITVTDNNQCSSVETVSLNEPNMFVSSEGSKINASCKNLSDGSAKVNVSGGTAPYTYLWSDNQTNDSAINLSAGSYTVSVTDANSCISITTINITEPDSLLTNMNVITNVSCNGFNDGSAFVQVSGGTQPYTYLWSDSQVNDTATALFAGTYQITVSDANGCSALDTILVDGPNQLTSPIAASADVSCNGGSDGFASVNVSGGTQPYTYIWSDNQMNDTALNLSAGTYTITITDANNCNSGASITINEPAALSPMISSTTNVSCNGLNDGRSVVQASGGTSPYTYLWSDNQNTDTARNLVAGTYTVTITDSNNCSAVTSTLISEPVVLSSAMISSTDVSCNGGSDGSATVNASGGTTPYSYLWNNSESTANIDDLLAGTYEVTVTDAQGCTDNNSVNVNEPPVLISSINSWSNISCNGAADGTATVTGNGGTPPYTFSWSHGPSTADINSLSPGTYTVTVTDAESCVTTSSIIIDQPAQLTTAISNSFDVSCFGLSDGQASVVVNGGTTPYTYFWNNNQTSNINQNLSAGTYSITVTDANDCQAMSSVTISQPNPLSASLSGSPISCFGDNDGNISANVNGGSTPYNYEWSNGQQSSLINNLNAGSYSLTLTDFNGCADTLSYDITEPDPLSLTVTSDDTVCIDIPKQLQASAQGGTGSYTFNWNQNLGNSSIISVSPQANTVYSVSVTDANSCPQASESISLTVRDIASDFLDVTSSGNICVGDSSLLSVDFRGSVGPFSYQWNQNINGTQDQFVSPGSSTEYILNITDACGNVLSDSVLVEVSDPPMIGLNDTLIEGCEDLTVSFTNRTPSNYVYNWDFGDGNTSLSSTPTNTYTSPGTYSVSLSVSTPEGCESTSEVNHQVRVLPSPTASINASPLITKIDNPNITFSGIFDDATSWQWFWGDGEDTVNVNNFTYSYADTGSYTVSLYEYNGFNCVDSAFVRIKIDPTYEIKIPNVFIPSTGGSTGGSYNPNSLSNEVFHPFLEYVENYHLMVFNRWGELVFESKDVNIGWDGYYKGKLCQQDVYVYKLEVEFINGEQATKVGDVTLLR